jgi:hypothetical protein
MRHADPDITSHPSNSHDYNNEIYVHDLATGKERRISTYPGNDHYPVIDGDRIAWLRQWEYTEADVFVHDMGTGREIQVSQSRYAAFAPAIDGELVVWTDARSSKGNTSNDVVHVSVDEKGARDVQIPGADIYLYELGSRREVALMRLTASGKVPGFSLWVRPVMSHDFVVYELDRQVGPTVYAMSLTYESEDEAR